MGVHQTQQFHEVESLRVGRYGDRLNTSCIVYRLGETLIDTGPANQWRKIKAFAKERAVDRILITHHHEDHSGNAQRLQKLTEATVLAHEAGHDALVRGFHVPFYRRLVWGKPRKGVQPEPITGSIDLSANLRLSPITTPGHAEDMMCFLEPNRGWLFSGDLFIAAKPRFLRRAENPNREIESLRKVLSLDFDTVFCAHRGILENGKRHLQEKLHYLVTLRGQVLHYRSVGDSIQQIKRRLLGRESFLTLFSFGEFSKKHYIDAFAFYQEKPHYSEHVIHDALIGDP